MWDLTAYKLFWTQLWRHTKWNFLEDSGNEVDETWRGKGVGYFGLSTSRFENVSRSAGLLSLMIMSAGPENFCRKSR